ncbi:efflux RND transporter periplasmic adaptor subunit [Marivibrio halodurans]|uniref:Efflux RND transporter periplasmic adaptor subunit n=1 Tax=Marivibrio halodurans TaxID=2039722 RepID=A0A8J7V2P0_9PROT|nr:efflux RND transporter periplasmic adaptor subunit [Marivibrio halodurans]MBP5857535.1 efflux RND transporter periplasmic adaptor subunit [Marivibrio halodurans]
MSIVRQLLVIGVLALLGYGLWNIDDPALRQMIGVEPPAGNGGSATPITPEAEGVPVVVAPVVRVRADTVIEAVGSGRAQQSVTLYPQVGGEVSEVLFEAGDHVEAGAPLMRLDDRREQLALDLALVAVRDARQTLERFKRAVRTGAVSESEVDTAQTTLDRAELERDQAEVALEDRTLRAPFDGVIGIAQVEPGDRVTTDTEIASFDDRSSLLVDFEVPEGFLTRLSLGQPVRARTWSLADQVLAGKISAIDARVDSVSRTVRVRARLPNDEDILRPGMAFAVSIDMAGEERAAVPEVAVLWGRDGAYIWRVDAEGRAEKLFITVKSRRRGRVLIEGGLRAGDEVVFEGVQRMREGVKLSITDRREPAPLDGTAGAGSGPS